MRQRIAGALTELRIRRQGADDWVQIDEREGLTALRWMQPVSKQKRPGADGRQVTTHLHFRDFGCTFAVLDTAVTAEHLWVDSIGAAFEVSIRPEGTAAGKDEITAVARLGVAWAASQAGRAMQVTMSGDGLAVVAAQA